MPNRSVNSIPYPCQRAEWQGLEQDITPNGGMRVGTAALKGRAGLLASGLVSNTHVSSQGDQPLSPLPVPALCAPSCSFFIPLAAGSLPWAQQMCEHSGKVSFICRTPYPQALQSRAVGGNWCPCKGTLTDPSSKASSILHGQAENLLQPQCPQIPHPVPTGVPLADRQLSHRSITPLGYQHSWAPCVFQPYRAKVCLIRLYEPELH